MRTNWRYWVRVADTHPRRIVGAGLSLLVWCLAFGVARAGAATPTQDTPPATNAKAHGPPERRLLAWAAKHAAKLSLTVAALPEGKHVILHDGGVSRNPASVSKLVTAFVALKSIGSSYQYKTTVHGRLVDGHIQRLVIRGEGDPTLTSDTIQGIATRLSAIGLTSVDEAVVVDQSYFDDQFVPPAFEQQPDEWSAFRAPVCATAVDKNRLTLRVFPRAAGSDARVFVEPLGAAELSGRIRSVDQDTKGSGIKWSILPFEARPTVRVKGEVGVSEAAYALDRRTEDPRKLVGYVLREALQSRGIEVPKNVTLGTVDGSPILYTHQSDPLSTLLYRLGKESDNFAAEMLLKTIGAKVQGVGSSEAGAKVVVDSLAALGPMDPDLRWVNGSGLFDANRVSTNLLVRVLGAARADPSSAPEYLAQLSIAGSDGTLSRRLRTLPRGCSVRAKTGTLREVISLAGYVGRLDGSELAFALIVEGVTDQAATRIEIDRFVESLCSAPLEVLPQKR
jgi:serine-type D-Ala-D-Ala carboxypeptidase/endopeptidase (penicillin-binding protein 4)